MKWLILKVIFRNETKLFVSLNWLTRKNKSLIFFLQSLLNRTAGLNPATLQRCLKCCIKIAKLSRSMYIVIRRALLAEILFVYRVSFPPVFDLLINVIVSRLRASFDCTFFLAIDNPLVFFNIVKKGNFEYYLTFVQVCHIVY